MERLTEQHYKKTDGYYMKCSEHCCKEDFSCEDCEKFNKLVDRLAAIEDILGDEYELADVAPVREETVELQALRRRVESLERENADLRRALFCPSPQGGGGSATWKEKEDRNTAVLPRKFYQCNRMQCGARCSWPTCRHTADRAYAVRPDAPEEDF